MDRQIKKENNSQPKDVAPAYRTKSALRKAATKMRKSMPLAPSKRIALLNYMIHGYDDKDQEAIFCKRLMTKKGNGNNLSSDVVHAVEKFYQKDDISRMSPNVKDCRLILNQFTGKKETTPIRHLMFNLSEVYALFLSDYAKNASE